MKMNFRSSGTVFVFVRVTEFKPVRVTELKTVRVTNSKPVRVPPPTIPLNFSDFNAASDHYMV